MKILYYLKDQNVFGQEQRYVYVLSQLTNSPLEYFDRGLKNVIDSFERAKEWADLSNCLQKAKQQIEKYKNLPIPRQRDLAKRLAQCLNPEINVIHQLTLEVYKEVFQRELDLLKKEQGDPFDRKSSVALFFSGLFNFYQFAAFEVKNTFLDIISEQLLQMKKELILSLPGFMLCMLPALEDQNGQILKKVEGILIETEKIVGTSEFYGEIWKAMLRTPRARLPAIRYLDKRIPKDWKHMKQQNIHLAEYTIQIINHEVSLARDDQKFAKITSLKERMELEGYFFFYFPNKSQLVINALISGLSIVDNTNYVNRATLDFLISHMPIKSNINSIPENIRLVESVSLAYTKKDFATLNKLQNWLFEHFDDDEEEISSKDPTIITIVESQKNLFRKSMDHKFQDKMVTGTLNTQLQNHEKQINDPILILLRIMSEEQSTTVPILKHLSIHLIKFIRFHLNNLSDQQSKKFIGNLGNLLEHIAPSYRAVLESLAIKLQEEIRNLDFDNQNEGTIHQLESIDIISFAIVDMQQHYKKLLTSNESKQYLVTILSNLLKGMNQISNQNKNMQLVQPSLDVADQILKICMSLDGGATLEKQKRSQNFKTAIESFNQLYVSMCEKMLQDTAELSPQDDIQFYKEELDTFKKYNNIMFQIVPFQIVDSVQKQMPKWLDMMIQCSKKSLTKMCLVSVEVFIKILDLNDDDTNQVGGGTIMHIQRLIADSKGQQNFTDKQYKNQQHFKQEFLRLLQEPQVNSFDGNKNCKEIIQNLWSLLDFEIDTESIITHLKLFDLLVPKVFSDVVNQDLKTPLNQEKAIQKFTVFWKFTNNLYPGYKPFETEFAGKKYLALHNMINFLEDQDPTLRLSCRSWLSQSSKNYGRILDPIIEEFIANSNFQVNNEEVEAIIIEGHFESKYVIENFGKLRNIILNTQDEIMLQMILRNCQKHIVDLYYQNKQSHQFQPQVSPPNNAKGRGSFSDPNMNRPDQVQMAPHPQQLPNQQINYLDMLVEITLSFIRAEYQKQSTNHKQDNTLTVNASACEFMELLLKQVQKYTYQANKIAHFIVGPLINTFYHVISNHNNAMQVNIINLLEIIFQECNFQGQKTDQSPPKFTENSLHYCAAILKSQRFIESIILGLKSDVSFVRQKFIKFVEMLVPYMRKFTKENEQLFKNDFKSHIQRLTEVFCDLLKKVDIQFFSTTNPKQLREPIRNEGQRKDSSALLMKKNSLDHQQNHFESLVINQEADILQIIGGLQGIINTCLDIKLDADSFEDEQNEEANEEDIRRKLNKNDKDKKSGFWGGLLGGGDTTYFATDTFIETKRELYEKLPEIFVSCIHCWNHIPLLNWSDYHFTRHGMFAYNQEDTHKINKIMKNKKKGIESYFTFEELLQNEYTNPIQRKVISFLRPIAKKIPNQFVEGIMSVWLHKTLLKSHAELSKSYEKLIQMLICVYQAREHNKGQISYTMPVHQVIYSLIKYISEYNSKKGNNPLVNLERAKKTVSTLDKYQTSSESLLNSFLYAYLAYNPTMFDPLFDKRNDEKVKEYARIYQAMLKYFNIFKYSRNPFTISWLLELLNLLGLKIRMEEAKLDPKTRRDYHDLLNNMLTNCSSIVSDTFNIQFDETQKWSLSFPPTVYEMLWRYQYIQNKSVINEVDLRISENPNPFGSTIKMISGTISGDAQSVQESEISMKSGQVRTNELLFFDKNILRQMVDQKFEYINVGGGQNSYDQSIFKNLEILMNDKNNLPTEYKDQSDFLYRITLAIRGKTNPKDMLVQTKFFTIITIKQILNQLLYNLVGTDTEKNSKSIQIILQAVIQILKLCSDGKIQKSRFSNVMNEFLTEFFASIVERSHQIDPDFFKPYRRDIIDLFNAENFFQVSKLNLKQWQKIMKYFIDGKPEDILEEQMQKWNMQGGLFQNINTINIQKCYAMKKIAFLIFSCDTDDFISQLEPLMKKMIEVFKQSKKADVKQRLFLFFLTRVLLIRLNPQSLTEALRKLWPHLLNELISVFEVLESQMDKDNTDLTIEAIKLVELLSSLNIEDFQMNQWIFLIDGYGMELTQQKKEKNSNLKPPENKSKDLKNALNNREKVDNLEVFKTFIVRFIGDQEYSFYNVDKPEDGLKNTTWVYEDAADKAYKANSEMIDTQSDLVSGMEQTLKSGMQPQSVLDQKDIQLVLPPSATKPNELQEQACNLQMSINKSNVIGNQFNRNEAESKIELDFLVNDIILFGQKHQ